MHPRRPRLRIALPALLVLIVGAALTPVPAATGTFRDDDPLRVEPETQDSRGREWDIDLTPFGATATASAGRTDSPVPLPQVKDAYVCIDIAAIEPPDSSWTPVRVYFRRGVEGWVLVSLDRTRA